MATLLFLDLKDVELEEKIGQAIRSREKPGAVQVVVKDGYVHLLGWVDKLQEKKDLTPMVEAIPGVRMVINHIHVKSWEEKRNFAHF